MHFISRLCSRSGFGKMIIIPFGRFFLSVIVCLQSGTLLAHHSGRIVGTVIDEHRAPLVGLTVRLNGSSELTTTDTEGYFEFHSLADGSYALEVSGIGFEPKREHIVISQGQTVSLAYELLEMSQQLTEVRVSMSPIDAVMSLSKIDVPLRDLPLSANSISAKQLQERGVDDIGGALKSVTGIRANYTYGGFQYFTIRGFSNFVLLLDGVRDERHNLSNSAPSTNLANVAAIEVLKGPASVLYGHSALGGMINIIRNKPTESFRASFSTSYGSFNSSRISAGAGGAINPKLRYRIDFGVSESDGFRQSGSHTQSAYLALDYRPTLKDHLLFSIGANKDFYDTDAGIPLMEGGERVSGMASESRYNDPQDFLENKQYNLQLSYSHTFNSKFKLNNTFSYYDDNINYFSTEELTLSSQLDSVKRSSPYYFNHLTKPIFNQLELTFQMKTGRVKHRLLAGHSLGILNRKTFNGKVVGSALFSSIPVINPVLNQGYLSYEIQNYKATEESVHGIYLQDFLNISARLTALAGVRFDHFEGRYYTDQVDPSRTIIEKGRINKARTGAVTYRLGLVYKALEPLSFYGSYSTYFKPTRRISSDGESFAHEKGYQAELGAKLCFDTNWTGNMAFYYMRKDNQLESLPGGVYKPIGSAASKGMELEVQGRLLPGFQVTAGYTFSHATYLDHEGIETNPLAGNLMAFAPRQMANVWMNYEIPSGPFRKLGVGLGANAMGQTFTSPQNTFVLPSYTLVDAALRYQIARIGLRLHVNNLLNEQYYANAIFTNQFSAGPKRNFLMTVRYAI